MTDAEKKLWFKINHKQFYIKFRRQQPIGKYIVDFVCFEKKLVIEIDGSQHLDNHSDKIRDEWLKSQNYKIIRFWDNDVLNNIDGVLECILKEISPSPLSPPIKGGG